MTDSDQAEQEYVEKNDEEWRDADEPNTFPSGDTLTADRADAAAAHDSDRPPTPDEERAAPTEVDRDVSTAYEEAIERGANVEGEGDITPD